MLQPRARAFLRIQLLFVLGLSTFIILLISFYSVHNKKSESSLTVIQFPEPRELKPFYLGEGSRKAPAFSLANLKNHWTFLFFGFTHCSEICPATLSELKDVYQDLQGSYPEVQVVFISLDPEQDDSLALKHYLSSFNEHFIGVSGTLKQLNPLKQQLGVQSEGDEMKHPSSLNHTSSVFLINPQGQWLALFPYGLRAKEISRRFEAIVKNTA
jgi:protein SCO1/2